MPKLSKLKDNVLFVNITSQGLVQIANYLIPLLLIPYVTHKLGTDAFGKASYAQNIGIFLTLLVNYGFDYSATQQVALNKEDHGKLQTIFSTVILFKLFLFLLSLLIVGVLYLTVEKVHADVAPFLVVALFNLGWVLFPTWFFQGVERMAKMSMFTFFVKLLGALLVIAMVSKPEDYCKYLVALTVANVLVGCYSCYYLMKQYDLKWQAPEPFSTSESVRKGFPIFLNAILINCNTCLGVFLMGFYMSDAQIGIYAGTQKIITAIMMVSYQPLMIALFPRVSRKFHDSKYEGWLFFKKCLGYIALYATAVSVATYVFAPLAVKIILGSQFSDAVSLLRLLAVYPLLASLASTLTVHGLYGLQLQRFAPLIGGAVCVTSVVFNYLFVPTMGAVGAIYAWLICEVVEISIAVSLLMWKKGSICLPLSK